MRVHQYESEGEWKAARMGKITGSKLSGLITKRGNGKKMGYYELIAEHLVIPEVGGLSPMDRGSFLEEEAILRFAEDAKKEVKRGASRTSGTVSEHWNF